MAVGAELGEEFAEKGMVIGAALDTNCSCIISIADYGGEDFKRWVGHRF